MTQTQQQDAGLVQRGLVLLGGMTALVVVVLLIVVRTPDAPKKTGPTRAELTLPVFVPAAAFPATPSWPQLIQLGQQMPSAPGWEIRYNAALALARRGSPSTPWPLVREMLDEDQQRRNFRVVLKKGQEIADEESAQRTIQNALHAVAQWHKKQDPAAGAPISGELQLVYALVDRLAQGPNTVLRVQADRVRQEFLRK